jgi:mono/diheme cytochrome c family protein
MPTRLLPAALLGAILAASNGNAQAANRGQTDYLNLCASCHGRHGQGDGPVGKYLKKPPADLTRLSERNAGVFPAERIYEKIDGRDDVGEHGPREMPVWGRVIRLSPATGRSKFKRIVDYLATLQRISK